MKTLVKSKGFTLVEMAIVLTIVGVLLAGGMSVLSSSTDSARYKETQNQLNEVKEALTSYYIQFGRLPCPDAGIDGIEESSCATGNSLRGFLPHVTLGLGGNGDAWGERIKYLVSPKFTAAVTPPTPPAMCTDTAPRNISTERVTIQNLQATAQPIADFAAFALISTGKNGRQTNAGMTGAFSDGGCSAVNAFEQENCNSDSIIRSGVQQTDGNSIVFDDMVVWGSDVQLIGLLKKSGMCVGAISNNTNNTNNTNQNSSSSSNSNSSGGCTVAQSGNDFGLVVMFLTAVIGIWLKSNAH
jgi:prepilin-type N-terminal cleavage/methylation domain-containing protein